MKDKRVITLESGDPLEAVLENVQIALSEMGVESKLTHKQDEEGLTVFVEVETAEAPTADSVVIVAENLPDEKLNAIKTVLKAD